MRKSSVWTTIMIVGFLSVFVIGCNKQDKLKIVGTWEIDLKEAKGLGESVDSAKERLYFVSGSDHKFTQVYWGRENKKPVMWTIKGNFDRKGGKISFINRVKDENDKQGDLTYKYELEEDSKLTLIIENEGFPNDKKVYTNIQKE